MTKRKRAKTPGTTLGQVGSTSIYLAPAGETLAFLLYGSGTPPKSVQLVDTWAATGTPPAPGYYLFLTNPPTPSNAAALESALRAALPPDPPTASGCAWVTDGKSFQLNAVFVFSLDDHQHPILAADTPLPSGAPSLAFAAGTSVFALPADGEPTSLVLSHPPLKEAYRAGPAGVTISLLGPLTRRATCTGLWTLFPPSGDSAVKNLVTVQIDPLAAGGGSTEIGIPGPTLVLTKSASGYTISDVSDT
jgi:hypothetical protein